MSGTTELALGPAPSLDKLLAYLGTTKEELLSFERLMEIRDRPDVTAILSGSLAEGLGNVRSDIDIFVLGENPQSFAAAPDASQGGSTTVEGTYRSFRYQGKRRIDVAFLPLSLFNDAAEILSRPESIVDVRPISEGHLIAIHRLRIGLPLLHPEVCDRIRAGFPFHKLSQYLQRLMVETLDSLLEDVYGMIEDEDIDTTLLRCHTLLQSAYGLHTFTLGNTNPNTKWALRIMRRYASDSRASQLLEMFWGLFYPDVSKLRHDRSETFAHVKRVIETTNMIVEWAQEPRPT
jgi:hypothetical protein